MKGRELSSVGPETGPCGKPRTPFGPRRPPYGAARPPRAHALLFMCRVSSQSQGVNTGEKQGRLSSVNDVSVSNSICFVPLDMTDGWGLPHKQHSQSEKS